MFTRVYVWAGPWSMELSEDVMSARGAAPPRHSFCKQTWGHELHKGQAWVLPAPGLNRTSLIQVTPGEQNGSGARQVDGGHRKTLCSGTKNAHHHLV